MLLSTLITYLQTFPPDTPLYTDKDSGDYGEEEIKHLYHYIPKGENGPYMIIQN